MANEYEALREAMEKAAPERRVVSL